MFLEKTNRKIIPRWRDFLTTVTLGELSSPRHHDAVSLDPENRLDGFRRAWIAYATLWHALDFIGAAFVLGRQDDPDVKVAATFIEAHNKNCPTAGLNLARIILNPTMYVSHPPEAVPHETQQIRTEIHFARLRLQDDPRNSVGMMDLARLYTILGRFDKATYYVEMAHKQSPDNRFVLRSAARFFLHLKDTDRALHILRASDIMTSDPWVSAAEIGVASVAGRPPRSVKTAVRILERGDFRLSATSELASALGTLELNNDRQGPARKLFRQSLKAPTENSLAQAEWASKQVGGLDAAVMSSGLPRTYEAKALYGLSQGQWQMALDNSIRWLQDQPFSSRPASVVSYVYDAVFEDHNESAKILETSLISNPGDRMLMNNLAFALASQGKIEKAEELLRGAQAEAIKDTTTITLCATLGLVHFRKKYYETGRGLYLDAMALARQANESRYEALAALNLAREEIRANLPTKSATVKQALQLARKFDDPDIQLLASRVLTMDQLDSSEIRK